jgi:hypothetical protein
MDELGKLTVADIVDAVMDGLRDGVIVGLVLCAFLSLVEIERLAIASHAIMRDLRDRLPVEPAKESEDAQERS